MRKLLVTTLLVTLSMSSIAQEPAATAHIVSAADTFLASLDAAQRQSVLYDFGDNEQRARWSNFPTGFVPRGGLSLKQMSAPQREAAMKLLATVLSPMGIEKVEQIRQADDDFKVNGSKRGPGGGGRGGRGGRGPAGGDMFGGDLYYISFLGKPSTTAPWMLQFGGHHLALNITMVGRDGILTPSHTAAQPAKYTVDGKTVRPLGAENDKAFALINALDEGQRKQAILNYKVADLVLGPGQDGKTIQPEGIKCSAMSASQQAMLLDLVGEWAGIVNEQAAAVRMAEIKANLSGTWFAWSGPTTNGMPAYYRIQGPTVVIEYAPQPLGGDPTMHIHTIYRDPTNDYGKKSVGH